MTQSDILMSFEPKLHHAQLGIVEISTGLCKFGLGLKLNETSECCF